MKIKGILLIILSLCWMQAYSQEDSKNYWGVNFSSGIYTARTEEYFYYDGQRSAGYEMDITQEKYLITPSVSYNFNKHSILLGPRFYLPEEYYKRIGTQLSYEYNLFQLQKRIGLVVGTDLIYSYEHIEKERMIEGYPSNHVANYNYLHSLAFPGVKAFLTSELYFNLSIGAGIGLRSSKSTDTIDALPAYDDLNRTTGLFDQPKFNSMLKIGFGYNFR